MGVFSGMLLGSVSAHLASHAPCRPRSGSGERDPCFSPALDTRPP